LIVTKKAMPTNDLKVLKIGSGHAGPGRGRVDVTFDQPPNSLQHVGDGNIKVYGRSGAELSRHRALRAAKP